MNLQRRLKSYHNPCSLYIPQLTNHLFDKQLNVLRNPNRFQAICASRRSGKSTLFAIALYIKACTVSNRTVLYIARTKTSAKEIIWYELMYINDTYNIQARFNHADLTVTLPNGSRIYVAGCKDRRTADDFRGNKHKLIVIDEASLHGDVLEYLIYDALKPTLLDYKDTQLWLAGTPNETCTGLFYEIMETDKYPLYQRHKWSFIDNIRLPQVRALEDPKAALQAILDEEQRQYELEGKGTKFRREYLLEWVRDEETLVYDFQHDRNTYTELPQDIDIIWSVGIDVGYNDPCSVVAVGITKEPTPIIYIDDVFEQSEIKTPDLAPVLERFRTTYKPISMATDSGGGGKRLIEDLNAGYNMSLTAADKPKKRKYPDLVQISSLMSMGRIKINRTLHQQIENLRKLVWIDRESCVIGGGTIHTTDALVYAFRELYPWLLEKQPKPEPTYKEQSIKALNKQQVKWDVFDINTSTWN